MRDYLAMSLEEALKKWEKVPIGRAIDETGNKYGMLEVIYKTHPIAGKTAWVCKCECGNYTTIRKEQLTSSNSKKRSCGCLKAAYGFTNTSFERTFLEEGEVFGVLKILRPTKVKGINRSYYYECECLNCGSIENFTEAELKNGHRTQCSNCSGSVNEKKINLMLSLMDIPFESEKIFFDKLRYDFYVADSYVIEYDGEQHFIIKTGDWGDYETIHAHDLLKNKYCFEHNIPIIRIPYNMNYTEEDLKLETTNFLLTPENEEEYYARRIK